VILIHIFIGGVIVCFSKILFIYVASYVGHLPTLNNRISAGVFKKINYIAEA